MVLEGSVLQREVVAKARKILRFGAGDGQAHGIAFDADARLDELPDTQGVQQKLAAQRAHVSARAGRFDHRAHPLPGPQQPHGGKLVDGFPQGVAAHPELLRQLVLGRQLLTAHIATRGDHLVERFEHLSRGCAP